VRYNELTNEPALALDAALRILPHATAVSIKGNFISASMRASIRDSNSKSQSQSRRNSEIERNARFDGKWVDAPAEALDFIAQSTAAAPG
jgi:hypothetical protein